MHQDVEDEFTDFLVEKCCEAWVESYRNVSVAFKAWFEMPEGLKISMRRDVRTVLRASIASRAVSLVTMN